MEGEQKIVKILSGYLKAKNPIAIKLGGGGRGSLRFLRLPIGKTHIKKCFFFNRTTKQKNTFFLKSSWFSPKIEKKVKKLSKSVSSYHKTKKKEKKVAWTTNPLV